MKFLRSVLICVVAALVLAAPVTARSVLRQGTVRASVVNYWFDLDAGVKRAEGSSKADLWWYGECVDPSLSPSACDAPDLINGAPTGKARLSGPMHTRPSYQTCKNRSYGGVGDESDGNGAWYCFKTGAGRYARVQVLHWPTTGAPSLRFSYLVWV